MLFDQEKLKETHIECVCAYGNNSETYSTRKGIGLMFGPAIFAWLITNSWSSRLFVQFSNSQDFSNLLRFIQWILLKVTKKSLAWICNFFHVFYYKMRRIKCF